MHVDATSPAPKDSTGDESDAEPVAPVQGASSEPDSAPAEESGGESDIPVENPNSDPGDDSEDDSPREAAGESEEEDEEAKEEAEEESEAESEVTSTAATTLESENLAEDNDTVEIPTVAENIAMSSMLATLVQSCTITKEGEGEDIEEEMADDVAENEVSEPLTTSKACTQEQNVQSGNTSSKPRVRLILRVRHPDTTSESSVQPQNTTSSSQPVTQFAPSAASVTTSGTSLEGQNKKSSPQPVIEPAPRARIVTVPIVPTSRASSRGQNVNPTSSSPQLVIEHAPRARIVTVPIVTTSRAPIQEQNVNPTSSSSQSVNEPPPKVYPITTSTTSIQQQNLNLSQPVNKPAPKLYPVTTSTTSIQQQNLTSSQPVNEPATMSSPAINLDASIDVPYTTAPWYELVELTSAFARLSLEPAKRWPSLSMRVQEAVTEQILTPSTPAPSADTPMTPVGVLSTPGRSLHQSFGAVSAGEEETSSHQDDEPMDWELDGPIPLSDGKVKDTPPVVAAVAEKATPQHSAFLSIYKEKFDQVKRERQENGMEWLSDKEYLTYAKYCVAIGERKCLPFHAYPPIFHVRAVLVVDMQLCVRAKEVSSNAD